MAEINENTDLQLEYETIKKGRPIIGVNFKLQRRIAEKAILMPHRLRKFIWMYHLKIMLW